MSNSNCNFRASGFKFEADRKYEKKISHLFFGFRNSKTFFPAVVEKQSFVSKSSSPSKTSHSPWVPRLLVRGCKSIAAGLRGSGGGGTSGRAMAFCLDRPGSDPGTELSFFQ